MAPVSCLECITNKCERVHDCKTLPMWEGLNDVINEYLDGITIADLTQKECAGNDFII